MFSERALAYLQSLERRSHVEDIAVVRDALLRNGVPAKDAFLELHGALAGYVEPAGKDEFVYGIVHVESYWYGSLTPDAYEHNGLWYITYADAHPSYERQVDENGVMYQEGGARRASSYVSLIEQHAFIAEFWNSGPACLRYVNVPSSAAIDLREHLEPHRARELSDGIATVWATPGWRLFAAETP